MTIPLTSEKFGELFTSFRSSAFRLETLDQYAVSEEETEYRRYMDGELFPATSEDEWAQLVKDQVRRQGKSMRRVHVVSMPLSPYLRYEVDWGYLYSSRAGEDIRLLERASLPVQFQSFSDYWLFDQSMLVLMRYDSDGAFLGGEIEDSEASINAYLSASDSLWSVAKPLKAFLHQLRTE